MKVERPFFLQGLLCVSRVTIFHAKGIRNRRRVFRLPRQFNKNASVPRFVNPKIISVRIKLRGKSKEGDRSPLLGRFKGIAKGQGSHANPAKRFVWEKEEQRNGRGLSAASGGQDEGCGVCSDAAPPLCDSFFRPSTALSFSYEKESAVETVRSHALCCAKKKGLNVSGPARDFLSEAGARLKAYRVYIEAEQRTSGRKDPSWDHMKAKIAFTHRYVI